MKWCSTKNFREVMFLRNHLDNEIFRSRHLYKMLLYDNVELHYFCIIVVHPYNISKQFMEYNGNVLQIIDYWGFGLSLIWKNPCGQHYSKLSIPNCWICNIVVFVVFKLWHKSYFSSKYHLLLCVAESLCLEPINYQLCNWYHRQLYCLLYTSNCSSLFKNIICNILYLPKNYKKWWVHSLMSYLSMSSCSLARNIHTDGKIANLQEIYNSEYSVLYLNAHVDVMTFVATVVNYEIFYTVSGKQEKESREWVIHNVTVECLPDTWSWSTEWKWRHREQKQIEEVAHPVDP